MRKISFYALLGLCVIALAGCGNKTVTENSSGSKTDDAPATTVASNTDSDLLGNWKGELKMPEASKDDPGAAMAKGFGDMFAGTMSLEIMEGSEFKLSMMMIPVTGKYTREGDNLTLTPEKIMGMTPDQYKEMQKSQGKPVADDGEFAKPMHLVISADKNEIVMEPEKGKEKEGSFVFKRDKGSSEDNKEVVSKVSSDVEKSVVGNYAADLRVDESKLSEKDKKDLPMAKAMLGSAKLNLLADKTFKMNLMVDMAGTWEIKDDTVILRMTKVMGMESKDKDEDPLKLIIMDGGKTLHAMKMGGGTGEPSAMDDALYFVKK